MSPVAVETGAAALAELSRGTEEQSLFRIVLLDAAMPGLDAFELAQQLKGTTGDSGTVIMMLSPTGQSRQAAHRQALGLDVYLNKPVRQSALLSVIMSVLCPGADTDSSARNLVPVATPADERSLHVLLAEDNLINQRVAVRLLEKRGHTVEVAANGRIAVELFAQQRFGVVLMDVEMPEMNGFDATGMIRENERQSGRHTPIIAMTAHAIKGDRERCLAAGMDDYISKPIKAEELLHVIHRRRPATGIKGEPSHDTSYL